MASNRLEDLSAAVEGMSQAILSSLGETGVRLIREQMLSGYQRPILRTGALLSNVHWTFTGSRSIEVGSSLPYAPPVHNGRRSQAGRPYVTDAIRQGQDELRAAAASAASGAL